MDKLKIIIFAGVDSSGKSTIKKELEKKSNWKYICLDRFSDSIIYDKLYGRQERTTDFLRLESDLVNNIKSADFYLVYLYCSDEEEQLRRLNVKKETKDVISSIKIAEDMFENYLNITYFPVLALDTAYNNINKTVNKIINWVEKTDE